MRRGSTQVVAIDSLPEELRAAVMAYDGSPLTIAMPCSCRWCRALYTRDNAIAFQRFHCSVTCYRAEAADVASRAAKKAGALA